MFHIDIGENFDVRRVQQLPLAQQVMRDALKKTLVGHPRAAEDVHSNVIGPGRDCDGQRRKPIVPQHINSQRQRNGPLDFNSDRRELRHDIGWHAPRIERHVTEVFHHQPVHAPSGQRFGIPPHQIENRFHTSAIER